jgi:hypothetical protein
MKRYEQARPLVELARNYGAAFSFGRLVMVSVLLTMGLETCARADTRILYVPTRMRHNGIFHRSERPRGRFPSQ